MSRVGKMSLVAGLLVLACQSGSPRTPQSGTGGNDETVSTGGTTGTGGKTAPAGTGGSVTPSPDAAEADGPASGTGGATGGTTGTGGSAPDAQGAADSSNMTDAYPDSAFLNGRPDIRLCKKEWTMEQCC